MSTGYLVIKLVDYETLCIGDDIEVVLMPSKKLAIKAPNDIKVRRRKNNENTDRVQDFQLQRSTKQSELDSKTE